MSIRRHALAALALSVSLAGCITEDAEPLTPDAGAQGDGGAAPDGGDPDGGDPDAQAPDSGAPTCEGPDPSAPGCVTDTDCAAGEVCRLDPNACAPSACDCSEGDGWLCTADCGPVDTCQPAPPACGPGNECPPNARCVDGVCEVVGADCVSDYDCPNSACEAGTCLPPCVGDGEPALCDAIPPVCRLGTSAVTTGGCYDCQVPGACESDPGETCWGAFRDPDGVCLGANDGVLPEDCCRVAHYRHQRGTLELTCGPADGLASALRFSLGDLACGAQAPSTLTLFVWQAPEALAGQTVPLGGDQGMASLCDLDACFMAEGEISFAPRGGDHDASGRFRLQLPEGGPIIEATFEVLRCGELPEPACG